LEEFRADILAGLARPQKRLPSKYLYDDDGSHLFEDICTAPEYYPTRTERELLNSLMPDLDKLVEPGTVMVEFGSGACVKTRVVLDGVNGISSYVPIEICESWVMDIAQELREEYPGLKVFPVAGDFMTQVTLPAALDGAPRLGFFPGSTIGNLTVDDAVKFLTIARNCLGPKGRLLLGVDMQKDVDTLIAAYDDAGGITRDFNRNILTRINRELDGNFDLKYFRHCARWNDDAKRIEMHLESLLDQTVSVAGRDIAFAEGETIHTENSHKYTVEGFGDLAARAGWRIAQSWVSPPPEFAVLLLEQD
jgi:dimethylhistidine N-methyltransferase